MIWRHLCTTVGIALSILAVGQELAAQPHEMVQAVAESDHQHELVTAGSFPHSILIPGSNVSVKIGGYAKLDLIQDFNTIGSTDSFDTTTIPTSGPQKTNTRLHARQTRLNLDFRQPTEFGVGQVFIEGDFFGPNNALRLRHAYGELGPLLAGQTFSTFMDETVMPDLVDFESPTGALLTRRALLRWTQPVGIVDGLEYSLAVEDPTPAFSSANGTFESSIPDFIGRFRFQRDRIHLQTAGFVTRAEFKPAFGSESDAVAWGTSLSGSVKVREFDKLMGQMAYGDGIERFRGFQSYMLDNDGSLVAAPVFVWYSGYEHRWKENLKSVFATSTAVLDATSASPDLLRTTDYLAVNLLWTPIERVRLGVEYLHGAREDQSGAEGSANRLQFACWYYLP